MLHLGCLAGAWQGPSAVRPLTREMDDEDKVPYFLWDEDLTVREVRERLARAPEVERIRWLGKIMREARDDEVWRFTTPAEVVAHFEALRPHLGRRLAFWEFLIDGFRRLHLVA